MNYSKHTKQITLQNHMIQNIALLLLQQWRDYEQLSIEYPLINFDHTTAVQTFNKLELHRVNDILNEVDTEYLTYYRLTYDKYSCAKAYILTGKMPVKL